MSKKRMCWYLGVILFLFFGCDNRHSEECTLYADPTGFTVEEFKIVLESIDEWNVATNGVVKFSVVIGRPPAGAMFPHTIQVATPEAKARQPTAAGLTVQTNTMYLMMDVIRDAVDGMEVQLKHTTLHELGHHMGMDHDEDPNTVMVWRPEDVTVTCLTEKDMRAFCQIYADRCSVVYPTCGK